MDAEPRTFYDIMSDEDLEELCAFLRAGSLNSAVLMPEDLPDVVARVERLSQCIGENHGIDASEWPRRLILRIGDRLIVFRKVEEGVYRIEEPR